MSSPGRQLALIVRPRDRASLRNIHYLQSRLGGVVQTVVLDDSYHIATLERPHQLVVDHTLEFMARPLGARGSLTACRVSCPRHKVAHSCDVANVSQDWV